MSKETENKTSMRLRSRLVPKLRFSEFENNGEWDQKKLQDVCEINPKVSQLPDEFVYIDLESVEKGNLLQRKIIRKEEAPSRAQRLLAHNDIVFQMVRPYQKNNYYYTKNDNYEYVASTGYAQLRVFQSSMFLYQLIHTDSFVTKVLQKCIGSSYPAINSYDLSFISVELPPKSEEQQKIAACLSSLDEVITGESQKLEVLKEHKKGLLQSLFPSGAETEPKFRFIEFKNSSKWTEVTLGEIGEPLMCKRIFKEETTTVSENNVPFYKIGTFGRSADAYIPKKIYEDYIRKYSFPNTGDILISASGTIGRLVIYDGLPAYFQDSNIIWLGHKEEYVLNRFLFYCYANLKWQTSDGGIISRLYNSDFKKMKIRFPAEKKEQNKIAATLSSLDNLINTQTLKIETQKLHKKGLLQGLFPDVKTISE